MWRISSAIRILIVVIITVFCTILGVLMVLITRDRPKTLYADSQIWSKVILWACGVKLIVRGRENIDRNKNYIFVANHESFIDIPSVFIASPLPLFFLAKKEMAKVPVMGWFIGYIGMIFIDRGNSDRAKQSLLEAGKLIRNGRNVISFPEGTRTTTGELRLFKRGSFILSRECGIDIIPMGIEGAYEAVKPNDWRIRPGTITVQIGEVISESKFRDLPIEKYAAHTQKIVSELISKAKQS